MHWLVIVSFLLLSVTPDVKPSRFACLPKGIQPTDVVNYRGPKPLIHKDKQAITVEETLVRLKAYCKRGTLVDGSGKQIYFFRLQGCWGNPPADYQEILERQNSELTKLKKRYTVIEMTCNPSGEQIS